MTSLRDLSGTEISVILRHVSECRSVCFTLTDRGRPGRAGRSIHPRTRSERLRRSKLSLLAAAAAPPHELLPRGRARDGGVFVWINWQQCVNQCLHIYSRMMYIGVAVQVKQWRSSVHFVYSRRRRFVIVSSVSSAGASAGCSVALTTCLSTNRSRPS